MHTSINIPTNLIREVFKHCSVVKFLVVEVFQNSNFCLKGQKLPVATMLSGVFLKGFPGGSLVKNLPASARDLSLFPGLGKSLGEGNGNPLQYSCLGNPLERGAWWATVHGVTNKLDMP